MKAEITKIGTDEKHYYNVHIDGEFMGVLKLNSKGAWMFSASAGSKTRDQHKAINDAWWNVEIGQPDFSKVDHIGDSNKMDHPNKAVKGW